MQFLAGVGFSKILIRYLPDLVSAGSPSIPLLLHQLRPPTRLSPDALVEHAKGAHSRLVCTRRDEAGRKLFDQIDRAIQLHDKLLIVLSKESISSNWVETELRRARRQGEAPQRKEAFPNSPLRHEDACRRAMLRRRLGSRHRTGSQGSTSSLISPAGRTPITSKNHSRNSLRIFALKGVQLSSTESQIP